MGVIFDMVITAISGATLPIVVNLILRKKDKEQEDIRRKDEEKRRQEDILRKKLSLHICDEIGINNDELSVKIINQSQIANASNIVVDMRFEDEYENLICEMKSIDLGRRQLLSLSEPREAKERELVIKYTSSHIDLKTVSPIIVNSANPSIYNLLMNDIVIKVKVSAINMITGARIYFPTKIFKKRNIMKGSFIEGYDHIKRVNHQLYYDEME